MRRSLTPLLIEFLNVRLARPASYVFRHALAQGKSFIHLGAATLNPRFHPSEKDNIATLSIWAVICFFFYTIRTFLTNPQEMRGWATTVHRIVCEFPLPLYACRSSCYASFSWVKRPTVDFWDMPRNLLFAATKACARRVRKGRFLGMSQNLPHRVRVQEYHLSPKIVSSVRGFRWKIPISTSLDASSLPSLAACTSAFRVLPTRL